MVYGKKIDKFINECKGTDIRVAMYMADEDLNIVEVNTLEESECVILSKKGNVFRISKLCDGVSLSFNARTYKSLKTQGDMIAFMEEHLMA